MSDRVTLISKKDLVIEWFSGSGNGGQYRNKHQNCCRIKHPESGAEGLGTKERSAEQNKKAAFLSMCKHPKMKVWISKRLMELRTGETVEERVERMMNPKNLKIEGMDRDGQWSVDAIEE